MPQIQRAFHTRHPTGWYHISVEWKCSRSKTRRKKCVHIHKREVECAHSFYERYTFRPRRRSQSGKALRFAVKPKSPAAAASAAGSVRVRPFLTPLSAGVSIFPPLERWQCVWQIYPPTHAHFYTYASLPPEKGVKTTNLSCPIRTLRRALLDGKWK
jgi:hypothetical protein